MADVLENASFQFVNYCGPSLSTDASVRKVIKKQAMKDVAAARRQSGNYGKCNLGQYPQASNADHIPNDESAPPEGVLTSSNPLQHSRCRVAPSENGKHGNRNRQDQDTLLSSQHVSLRRIPCSGLAISKNDFLLLTLVPLTGLRLGITTSLHLSSRPPSSKDHFSNAHLGTRKLISFIPSRYHEVPVLRYATNCVTVKLRQIFQRPGCWAADSEALVLSHYNRAVKALRVALEDENERMAADTLCAIELLSAFEVLNNYDDPHSWLHHIKGAARLIEARGSERFKTDFDLALFMTSIGPTVMEAFLSNKACFLEEDHWQPVLRRAVYSDSTFANQNHLVFALWHYLFAGPRMFKETTDVIFGRGTPEHNIEALIERLQGALSGLKQWLDHARRTRRDLTNEELEESNDTLASNWRTIEDNLWSTNITQATLRGTFIMCHILKSRLLYALAPSRFHHLEVECQKLADQIVESTQDLDNDGGERLRWTSFVSQSVWLAKGIRETKQSWSQEWQHRKGVIERWKYEAWCKAIGRTCPSS